MSWAVFSFEVTVGAIALWMALRLLNAGDPRNRLSVTTAIAILLTAAAHFTGFFAMPLGLAALGALLFYYFELGVGRSILVVVICGALHFAAGVCMEWLFDASPQLGYAVLAGGPALLVAHLLWKHRQARSREPALPLAEVRSRPPAIRPAAVPTGPRAPVTSAAPAPTPVPIAAAPAREPSASDVNDTSEPVLLR